MTRPPIYPKRPDYLARLNQAWREVTTMKTARGMTGQMESLTVATRPPFYPRDPNYLGKLNAMLADVEALKTATATAPAPGPTPAPPAPTPAPSAAYPPVNTVPGPMTVQAGGNITTTGFQVADLDSALLTVTLSVVHGVIGAVAPVGGTRTGSGTASVVMTGSPASLRAALAAGVIYTPTAGYVGADAMTIYTQDATGLSDTDAVGINVTAAAPAPTPAPAPAPVTDKSTGVVPLLTDGDLIPQSKWTDPCVIAEAGGWTMWAGAGVGFTGDIPVYRLRSTDRINWTLSPSSPVITKGAPGSWDQSAAETVSVVQYGGVYQMFYTGYDGTFEESRKYKIGFATSPDGIVWTKQGIFLQPTLPLDDTPNLDFNQWVVAEPGAVVVGTKLHVYFTAIGANTTTGTDLQTIGLTIFDPATETWSTPQMVLMPDQTVYPRATYLGYSTPAAVIRNGQVHLFFSVVQATPWKQIEIGNAISANGISGWTLNPLPKILRDQPWRSAEVLAPSAIEDSAGTHVWFGGNNGVNLGIGYKQLTAAPAPTPAPPPPPASVNVAEVGHSLTNQLMPAYLVAIAQSMGKTINARVQVIGGTSLKGNWDSHGSAETSGSANPQIGDVFAVLPTANPPYNAFVCTELVIPPLPSSGETTTYLANWRARVLAASPAARLFYYSTWAGDTNRSAWYANTGSNGTYFENMILGINAGIAAPKWAIIPAHAAMRRLYDEIAQGNLPWASGGIEFFFADGFHLNDLGNYFAACVQYGTIFQVSAVGAVSDPGFTITQAQLNQLQGIAWAAVSSYPYNGFPVAPPPPAPTPPPPPAPTTPPAPVNGVAYPFGARYDPYPFGIRPTNATNSQMDAAIKSGWDAYKAANVEQADYIVQGGYIIRMGDSPEKLYVSEGIGYGMLMTVLMAGYDAQARTIFDGLLKVARTRYCYGMVADGQPVSARPWGYYLMDWETWGPAGSSTPGGGPLGSSKGGGWNAVDGDLDMGLALLMADRQWGSAGTWNYKQEGLNTAEAIKRFNTHANGMIRGVGNNHTTRTSDFMFQHLRAFKQASGDAFWDVVIGRCHALLEDMRARFAPVTGLNPDFIVNETGELAGQPIPVIGGTYDNRPRPSPGFYGDGVATEGAFCFNAQRNPWRFGTDAVFYGDTRTIEHAHRITQWFKSDCGGNPGAIPTGYKLDGTFWPEEFILRYSPPFGGMVGPVMVGAMCKPEHQAWLNACWSWNVANYSPSYYNGDIQLMCMIVASGNWWLPVSLGGSAPAPAPVPTSTPLAIWGDSMSAALFNIGNIQNQWPGRTVFNGGVQAEASGPIKDRFIADTARRGNQHIIWSGHNNYMKQGVAQDIASMVAALATAGNPNYVIVGNLPWADRQGVGGAEKASFDALRTTLATTYGTKFLDLNAYMLTQGDGTAGDTADVAAGVIPRSLRWAGDALHLNESGNAKAVFRIKQFLDGVAPPPPPPGPAPAPGQAPIYLEAESAVLQGGLYVESGGISGATGTGYVSWWTNPADILTWTTPPLAAGGYDVAPRLAAADPGPRAWLSIDGGANISMQFGGSGWEYVTVPAVVLTAGVHTFRLTMQDGYYSADNLRLTKVS